MSDEPELVQHFGQWNSKCGMSRFPIGRVLLAFNLKTFITLKHEVGPFRMDETELLRKMFPELHSGDILVADRHFAGANLYVEYQKAGVEFITRIHQKLRISSLEIMNNY